MKQYINGLYLILFFSTQPIFSEELSRYFLTGFLYTHDQLSDNSKSYSIPVLISLQGENYSSSLASSYTTEDGQSSLGDTTLALAYNFGKESGFSLQLKEKFATGDKSSGLSTGENDTSLELSYMTALSFRASFFSSLGYTFVGKPDEAFFRKSGNAKSESGNSMELQNIAYLSLGSAYELHSQSSLGVILDYQQNIYKDQDSQSSITLFLNKSISPRKMLSVNYSVDNQEMQTLGLTLTTRF